MINVEEILNNIDNIDISMTGKNSETPLRRQSTTFLI